jgi:hypothetical protein
MQVLVFVVASPYESLSSRMVPQPTYEWWTLDANEPSDPRRLRALETLESNDMKPGVEIDGQEAFRRCVAKTFNRVADQFEKMKGTPPERLRDDLVIVLRAYAANEKNLNSLWEEITGTKST